MSQTPAVPHPQPKTEALARSRLYGLLAVGFRYPDAATFEAFRSGGYAAAVRGCLQAVPHLERLGEEAAEAEREMRASLEGVTLLDLEVGYNETFATGAPKPPCPPYEGAYRTEERTSVMVRVAEFYRHFGLAMNDEDGKRDLPDHLCAELEFLHFLAFKEAQAREEGSAELGDGYVLAQRDFLERHVAQWVPQFSGRLQERAASPLYARLAKLAQQCVAADLAATGSAAGCG